MRSRPCTRSMEALPVTQFMAVAVMSQVPEAPLTVCATNVARRRPAGGNGDGDRRGAAGFARRVRDDAVGVVAVDRDRQTAARRVGAEVDGVDVLEADGESIMAVDGDRIGLTGYRRQIQDVRRDNGQDQRPRPATATKRAERRDTVVNAAMLPPSPSRTSGQQKRVTQPNIVDWNGAPIARENQPCQRFCLGVWKKVLTLTVT